MVSVEKPGSEEFSGGRLLFLCKRWPFRERRSAGQLMRRSGRVNQLTAAQVLIRPLLFESFPSGTRFCRARHTTGTHQLASGRSLGPVVSFSLSLSLSFSYLDSSFLVPFPPASLRWYPTHPATFVLLSSGFLNDRSVETV